MRNETFGVPQPVVRSYPLLARKPSSPQSPEQTALFPLVMSWNEDRGPKKVPKAPIAYIAGLTNPSGRPFAWLARAMIPAHAGDAALVPPNTAHLPRNPR